MQNVVEDSLFIIYVIASGNFNSYVYLWHAGYFLVELSNVILFR